MGSSEKKLHLVIILSKKYHQPFFGRKCILLESFLLTNLSNPQLFKQCFFVLFIYSSFFASIFYNFFSDDRYVLPLGDKNGQFLSDFSSFIKVVKKCLL